MSASKFSTLTSGDLDKTEVNERGVYICFDRPCKFVCFTRSYAAESIVIIACAGILGEARERRVICFTY